MIYYSTENRLETVSLQQAVIKGLAPDKGLYMPQEIKVLAQSFFDNIPNISLQDIAKEVAQSFFVDDIPITQLNNIVSDALNFKIPIIEVEHDIYALELFHGPTFAFKDVGARFMARMLSYFVKAEDHDTINVLVATSGDTGSAVANGFLGVDGINVFVLYPSGKVSNIQEAQFTTLGQNITAIEVDGTFDDCQALVKAAFMDKDLNTKMNLTSANSINVARFLPQSFYYFHAYAQLLKLGINKKVIISVPSGNLGNLTAGLFAKQMGLPIERFISANNSNDILYKYLNDGKYLPKPSVQTIANAMDVGDPSNFARITSLFNNCHEDITSQISGYRYNDKEISNAINQVFKNTGYLLDPHGACAYMAAKSDKRRDETAIFLATAHPAKFKDVVEDSIKHTIDIPSELLAFMNKERVTKKISPEYQSLENILMEVGG